ncbi:hypothetical protein ACP4OV_025801 [Aristida adscensionis]
MQPSKAAPRSESRSRPGARLSRQCPPAGLSPATSAPHACRRHPASAPRAPPPPSPSSPRLRGLHSKDVIGGGGGGGASDAGRPWASLPDDLVRLVASRVLAGNLLDYVRFRAACTGWLSATASPRGRGIVDPRFHPRRWMMFPEDHGLHPGHPDLRGHIRFVNLDTGALVRVQLPIFGDHYAIDSVDGLLVLVRHQDSAVRLLHPFTGDVAELPSLETLFPQLATRVPGPMPSIQNLTRVVCASVSLSSGAITVMLAIHRIHCVAFASTLDQQWTLSSWRYGISSNFPLSFQGKLYVVDTVVLCNDVQIFQIDPPVKDGVGSVCELNPPKLIATLPSGNLTGPSLVECDSEILVLGYNDSWSRSKMVVFKLADLVQRRCIRISSIGGNTLLASERSLSVSSEARCTSMGDSVVLTDSRQQHLVQYHLISGTWSPAADDCSVYGPAPGPCSFIHHIHSCCIRSRWNRGLVFGKNPDGWFGAR